MKEHNVEQGECLNSIAYEKGFFWKTLWDAPDSSPRPACGGSRQMVA